MSYTQRDEEQFIIKATANVPPEDQRLLDIGAWHPIEKSNSRALIEAGWRAVLVEPSPMAVRALVQEYGFQDGISVMSAAVTVEQGSWVRLCISDDAVSSTEPTNIEQWKGRANYLGYMTVPGVTIADILNRSGKFSFVSIDTEGTSIDLFKQLIATEMFPPCIVVEHDGREGEAIDAAQARGYKLLYRSAENLVFGL